MNKVTQENLETFVQQVQAYISDYMEKNFPLNPKRTITAEVGRRYARIVITDTQRFAYCFVDMTNGDILKTESFKKPAKHARGNIFKEPLKALTPHGAVYR